MIKALIAKYLRRHVPEGVYVWLVFWSRQIGNRCYFAHGLSIPVFSVGPSSAILVNSIPKSGTNLLKNIVLALPGTRYVGDMSLADEIHQPEERFVFVQQSMTDTSPGCVYTGHIPYSPHIAEWLHQQNVKQIFIYRDPRDIVVSLYHYVMRDAPRRHAYYEMYDNMGTDSQRLLSAICGYGEGKVKYRASASSIPNIRLVYDVNMGWLTDENTLAVRFEDLIDDVSSPESKAVSAIMDLLNFLGIPSNVALLQKLVHEGRQPNKSHTFRLGRQGSWKEEFTDLHIQAFKDVTGDLLERLGYTWE